MRNKFFRLVISSLIFLSLAVFITYPLIFHLADKATGLGDELIIAYISEWVAYSLTHNPLMLFNSPNFYPHSLTLAYSDALITSSLIFAIPTVLIGQPIGYHNSSLILSLMLLGLSTYLLTYYLSKNWLASMLSGVITIFSPVVLDKYIHLQVLFIFFVPLSILFFFKFIKTRQRIFLILTMLCFVLQTYNSFLPGYFILFSTTITFLTYWRTNKSKVKFLFKRENILIVLAGILVIAPLTLPYYIVSKTFSYSRDIREAIHYAIQPEDLLYSNSFTKFAPFFDWLWSRTSYPDYVSFKNGYPGLVLLTLSVFVILYIKRNWKKQSYETRSLVFISITGLVLSLGPFLHIGRQTIHHPFPIPLPYAPLFYILPGFNGMRNSSRWEVLAILCFAVLVGIFLQKILKSFSHSKRLIFYLLIFSLVLIEYKPSIEYVAVPQKKDFPKEYSWLSQQPANTSYIEMPIYNWNMFPYGRQELLRQYYSTISFRRSVNGGSGFAPPEWQDKTFWLDKNFPSVESLDYLKSIGVQVIVVHLDEYDRLYKENLAIGKITTIQSQDLLEQLNKSSKVSFVKRFSHTAIFKLK